jgi:hypothetical protein
MSLPAMLQGLDVEAKRGGDGVDVFAVEFLENGGLACVIQATRTQVRFNNGDAQWKSGLVDE